MKSYHCRFIWFRPAITVMLFLGFFLFASGCAKVQPILYFPEPPAPPRVQLLTSFNNEGSLRNNAALDFLIGEELGDRFSKAYGMDFYNGQLYITDSGKAGGGLAIVDFQKRTIKRISDHLFKPVNVTIDRDGVQYVCDLGENQIPGIVVFDAQHRFLRRISFSGEPAIFPAAALIDGNRLYVADPRANLVYVLDKQSGAVLQSFGKNETLGWPVHLSKTPEGNIVVTESGAQTLRVYDPSGKAIRRIGSPGDRAGNFTRPKATAVDHDGNIYAVDVAFQNVQIFNPEGKVLMSFGNLPGSIDTLIMPAGIALSYDRMDIFQPYAAPGFTLEYVIAVSSQGGPPNLGSKVTIYGFGKLQGYDYN